MRVVCTACNHEHNNHHVFNHHLSEGHSLRDKFNPDAKCYSCGSVGKMKMKDPASLQAASMTLDVAPYDAEAVAKRQAASEKEANDRAALKAAQDAAAEEHFFQK